MKFELKSGFILTPGSYPWILDIPCWLLDILPLLFPASGCSPWILDIPCWLLDIPCWILDIPPPAVPDFRLFPLDIGYSVLVIGYSSPGCSRLQAVPLGYWIFRVGYWIFFPRLFPASGCSRLPAVPLGYWIFRVGYWIFFPCCSRLPAVPLGYWIFPALRDPCLRDRILVSGFKFYSGYFLQLPLVLLMPS